MTQKDTKRLAGILAGAYTCESCNSPSAAAIEDQAQLTPVCTRHGREAERQGLRVLWKQKETGTAEPAPGDG